MSDNHGQATADTHTEAATHGHGDDHHNHHAHTGKYWVVGAGLVLATFLTVLMSYVDFGSPSRNIIFAMLLASAKVTVVGAVFMHLKGERATVWRFLIFTAFFVTGLFLLTLFSWADPIFGSHYNLH